jgi:hypothetical protein
MPVTETDEKHELRAEYIEQLRHIWQSRKEGRITAGKRLELSDHVLDKIIELDRGQQS